ncbi:hypothetical protein HK414_13720 [Ramlibacter terrae]|uniref:Uncharacterized protein n=1 Tax=Ramlibacter terrae TaxID=2732511 RepID=A0ABX6P4E8_9BURK|nr:hypothetical protein HK414_13720 [Ramlibacter terrae]
MDRDGAGGLGHRPAGRAGHDAARRRRRLRRLQWRRAPLGLAAPGAVPPQVRATPDAARPVLAALGFEFRYTTASEPAMVSDARPLLANDVYQHLDKRTHAIVTMAPDTPDTGPSCGSASCAAGTCWPPSIATCTIS